LANEVFDQLITSVAIRNALFLKDGVGEVGTCFESKDFRQYKSVVAVEEEIGDLPVSVNGRSLSGTLVIVTHLRHVCGDGIGSSDERVLESKGLKKSGFLASNSR
jgi:hypothetical protein